MSDKKLQSELTKEPRPLYSSESKLGLLWSAKSGCTFSIKWYLYQLDLLNSAFFYSDWIHDFRSNVYYKSVSYKRSLDRIFQDSNSRFIKVVRNPYSRSVSGYLAYCQAAYSRDAQHELVLDQLSTFLGRKVDREHSFTFREFVELLKSIDIKQCNIHFREQISMYERNDCFKELHIIKLENSRQAIPKLERTLELKESDISVLRRSPHHTSSRIESDFCGDKYFYKSVDVALPKVDAFFDEEIAENIFTIYKDDFLAYRYKADSYLNREKTPQTIATETLTT